MQTDPQQEPASTLDASIAHEFHFTAAEGVFRALCDKDLTEAEEAPIRQVLRHVNICVLVRHDGTIATGVVHTPTADDDEEVDTDARRSAALDAAILAAQGGA